jgi:23S rRNA (cytosine1962-C5)-methyltransferase
VLAIDPDPLLARRIEEAAALNGLLGRITAQEADPFERLERLDEAGERFDIVVLQPDPGVVREARDLDAVRRRVFEVHRRALRVLDEGRLLVTWPSWGPLSELDFETTLSDAAMRGRKRLQVIARLGAGPDHPSLIGATVPPPAPTLVLRVLEIA